MPRRVFSCARMISAAKRIGVSKRPTRRDKIGTRKNRGTVIDLPLLASPCPPTSHRSTTKPRRNTAAHNRLRKNSKHSAPCCAKCPSTKAPKSSSPISSRRFANSRKRSTRKPNRPAAGDAASASPARVPVPPPSSADPTPAKANSSFPSPGQHRKLPITPSPLANRRLA